MEIRGSISLYWITLCLSWLNKDSVSLFSNGKCFLGNSISKLRIIITEEGQEAALEPNSINSQTADWAFHTWKQKSIVPDIVTNAESLGFIESAKLIPASATRNYYLNILGSDEAVAILGFVAHTYMTVALDHSMITESHIEQPLRTVMRTYIIQNHLAKCSLTSYGWNSSASLILSIPDSVKEDLQNCIRGKCRRHTMGNSQEDLNSSTRRVEIHVQEILSNPSQGQPMENADGWMTVIAHAQNHLTNVLRRLPRQRRTTYSPEIYKIINSASLAIAAQALLNMFLRSSSTGQGESSNNLPLHFDVDKDFSSFWDSTFGLPSRPNRNMPLSVALLRAAILNAALEFPPQLPGDASSIAACHQGRVALMAPLMSPSMEKKGILDVYVRPGTVNYEGDTFRAIVEEVDYYTGDLHTTIDSVDCLQTVFRVDGDTLRMRTAITCRDPKQPAFTVSYTKSISQLASTPKVNRLSEEEMRRYNYEDTEEHSEVMGIAERSDLWELVRQHVPQFDIPPSRPNQKLQYFEVDPRQEAPAIVCTPESLKLEIQFFICFPGTTRLNDKFYIQGNISLTECQTVILRRIFFEALSFEQMHRALILPLRRGGNRDALIQSFASTILQYLPTWRIIASEN